MQVTSPRDAPLGKFGYIWVTLLLFVTSLIGYVLFGLAHGMDFTELAAGFFENSQSEFLQLIWQVLGLKFLLCWGSPTSREGQDRLESKVDEILHIARKGVDDGK